MATAVACGWVGAVINKANPRTWAGAALLKPLVNAGKAYKDRQTHRPTDRQSTRPKCYGGTDGLTEQVLVIPRQKCKVPP